MHAYLHTHKHVLLTEKERAETLKDTADFLLQAISSVQLAGIADVLFRLPLS